MSACINERALGRSYPFSSNKSTRRMTVNFEIMFKIFSPLDLFSTSPQEYEPTRILDLYRISSWQSSWTDFLFKYFWRRLWEHTFSSMANTYFKVTKPVAKLIASSWWIVAIGKCQCRSPTRKLRSLEFNWRYLPIK